MNLEGISKKKKEYFFFNLQDFRSSFSSFASKYAKDSRFKNVDKTRDREDMFNDFVGDLYKKEKEEKKMKKEKAKKVGLLIFFEEKYRFEDFLELLGEQHGLTNKSKWSTVKKTMEDDEMFVRFLNVLTSLHFLKLIY